MKHQILSRKKALTSLFALLFVVGQGIKEFIFNKRLESSILFFILSAYVTLTHFDEHTILTVAILLCLYFSYDALTSLLKGELRARNDQLYKESLHNTEEQVKVLEKKRRILQDLKTFAYRVEQIKNSFTINQDSFGIEAFKPVTALKSNLELVLHEELYYLDSIHNLKNAALEKWAKDLDQDLGFTDSKIEDIFPKE